MVTKQDCVNAEVGDWFHHSSDKNADGTPLRVRCNGKTKTWKTRPDEFRMPIKHGLYSYGYIDQTNAFMWHRGYGDEPTDTNGCEEVEVKNLLVGDKVRLFDGPYADATVTDYDFDSGVYTLQRPFIRYENRFPYIGIEHVRLWESDTRPVRRYKHA